MCEGPPPGRIPSPSHALDSSTSCHRTLVRGVGLHRRCRQPSCGPPSAVQDAQTMLAVTWTGRGVSSEMATVRLGHSPDDDPVFILLYCPTADLPRSDVLHVPGGPSSRSTGTMVAPPRGRLQRHRQQDGRVVRRLRCIQGGGKIKRLRVRPLHSRGQVYPAHRIFAGRPNDSPSLDVGGIDPVDNQCLPQPTYSRYGGIGYVMIYAQDGLIR